MIIQTFAVYDSKAKAYMQPFFMHNPEMAIRSFTQSVTNEDTLFNQNPLDYTLFQIAEYDDEIGKILSLHVPEQLITAQQALNNFQSMQLKLNANREN